MVMSKIIRLSGEGDVTKLDLKDKKIMAILVDDARISLTQLAKKIGLKRETVDYRIKRLSDQGFITGVMPMLNFKILGFSDFEIFYLLDQNEQEKKQAITKLSKLPFVKSILEYSDRWDLKITVIAKGLEGLESINDEVQNVIGKHILEKEIVISLKNYSERFISSLFMPKTKSSILVSKKTGNFKIDGKDFLILKNLSEDGCLSTYQISEKVGMSPDGVGLRIKKMIESGIIQKFITLFDNSKMNLTWYTFAAKLRSNDDKLEEKLSQLFRDHPSIMSARKTIGGWDILFSIVCQTPLEMHSATREIKKLLASSIKNYETWTAYREPYFTAFPEVLMI